MSVAVDVLPRQLFIGGEWRDASGGATLGVEDPSTGEVFAEVADATPADAVAALDAAVAVQEEWARHPPRERGLLLLSCGLYGDVIRLLPPLTISDDDLTAGLDILEASIREVAA